MFPLFNGGDEQTPWEVVLREGNRHRAGLFEHREVVSGGSAQRSSRMSA
jgi:hypothetical protein